jgi:hypothetical protein
MKKSTKAVLTALVVAMVIAGVGVLIYFVIQSNLPNYIKDNNIPKGYVDTDSNTDYGKDLTEYFCYKYESKPDFNSNYTKVNSNNIKDIKNAINIYDGNIGETIDIYEDGTTVVEKDEDSVLAKSVTTNDFYYLTAHDCDGKEVAFDYNKQLEETNFTLYFYDTETNTLHCINVVW